MKQIRISIDDELHRRSKMAAIQLNMTLIEFIKAALVNMVAETEIEPPPKQP